MYGRNKHFIYQSSRQAQTVCTNCNQLGHSYKYCLAPVNSYGIIAFRVRDPTWTLSKGLTGNDGKNLNGIDDAVQNVEFLLIQRKDSLRFVDFVRGKYDIQNTTYLKQLLSNMTHEERAFLRTTTFEDMWKRVWGSATVRNYKVDYDLSKQRFTAITAPQEDGLTILEKLLEATTTTWTTPEWGFPKGRRNPKEDDKSCAIREFEEETGISRDKIAVVSNMEPLSETFFGDNNVHYCHKYYLAYIPVGINYAEISSHPHMSREIGDIGWFTLDDALGRIRSENVEKREILLRVSGIIRNYCCGLF
jgi:8-oxo-dGTP pyrophosphatase MutT (NUDIX family)